MQLPRRSFLTGTALALAAPRLAPTGWSASVSSIPVMVCDDFSRPFDPAYLSNGLIGMRPGPNPLAASPATVSGYVYRHPAQQVECLAPAPYPLATDIAVGDISLLQHKERVTTRRQTLDMASGELVTELTFEPNPGVHITVSVLQFASRPTPALLCQEITVSSNSPASLRLLPQITVQGIPGRTQSTAMPRGTRDIDSVLRWNSPDDLSQLGIATATVADAPFHRDENSSAYTAELASGRQLTLRTIAAMVSSYYHPAPNLQAIRMASWGHMLGFERLRQQNRDNWNSLWKSRVRIDGDADSQRALDAAFFYLHSSVHRSNQNGMPPFGLSQTEHYYGHSFWDTETWSLIPILLASPEAAKSLLEFRVRGLTAARKIANLYGHGGAQFPWEAAQTDGSEVTPVFADTGWSEQHVVPDVALAFWQYQQAAGDSQFLREATWPVLKAVAEWIESRGEFTKRGYEIRNIMGPNEGVNNVDNNAYVNAGCMTALNAAFRCAAQVGYAPPARWKRIASEMFLPRDPKTGALVVYDGSDQDAFPDLSFLVPFEPVFPAGAFERTYAAFKQRQREYMIGFATAGVATGAAFMGDRKLAGDLFNQSWRPFWMPPYGMIKEAEQQTYGCFLTDFGAMLQAVLIGFTGIRIQDGDWAKYPAALPPGWNSIEVDRIWVRGECRRLLALSGRKAQLTAA